MQDREIAVFEKVQIQDSKDAIPTYRYTRNILVRYKEKESVLGPEFNQLHPIIPMEEKSALYRVKSTIDIPGDKTFFEYDKKLDKKFEKKSDKKSKPKSCVEIKIKPEDFAKHLSPNHLKINKDTWRPETGVYDTISKMAGLYFKEISHLTKPPFRPDDILHMINNAKKAKLIEFYRQNHHFYNHDHRRIAKWMYWSLMQSLYANAVGEFRKEHGENLPVSFNIHQECHCEAMRLITDQLGADIARDVTHGGSFFGKNRTVEAMQDMGIMDDRKYTSSGRLFSGKRYCLFSGKPTISPSNKESILRSGGDLDVWEGGVGNPPKGSKLLSPRKLS